MTNVFDPQRLKILPLSQRKHKMRLTDIKTLDAPVSFDGLGEQAREGIGLLAKNILKSRSDHGKIVLMMGAHVLRQGNSQYIIDLMKRGIIHHIATNMAAAIHDFELAYIGATCEDVEFYIRDGQFGNWQETGEYLNRAINNGARDGIGMGQAIGRMINLAQDLEMPHQYVSIFNTAYRLGIPITVHKGIGYDITDQHPNADFEAMGKTSGKDFLSFTSAISGLEGGVFLNMGSAVMGPEVYLKALSMARNVAHQAGKEIRHFTTAVFDIVPLGDWQDGSVVDYRVPGAMSDPRYYFRPLKSILVRTVKDGGESFYIQGDFAQTVPLLYKTIIQNLNL